MAFQGLHSLARICARSLPERYAALYRDAAENGYTSQLVDASLSAPDELKARYGLEELRHGIELTADQDEALRRQLIEHANMNFAYRALRFLPNFPKNDRQTLKTRFIANTTLAYAQFALHEIKILPRRNGRSCLKSLQERRRRPSIGSGTSPPPETKTLGIPTFLLLLAGTLLQPSEGKGIRVREALRPLRPREGGSQAIVPLALHNQEPRAKRKKSIMAGASGS